MYRPYSGKSKNNKTSMLMVLAEVSVLHHLCIIFKPLVIHRSTGIMSEAWQVYSWLGITILFSKFQVFLRQCAYHCISLNNEFNLLSIITPAITHLLCWLLSCSCYTLKKRRVQSNCHKMVYEQKTYKKKKSQETGNTPLRTTRRRTKENQEHICKDN